MNCLPSSKPKYASRPSPPIPANECLLNTVKKGHDGQYWQVRKVGKSNRWVKCWSSEKNDDNRQCRDNLPENQFWDKGELKDVVASKKRTPSPKKRTPSPKKTSPSSSKKPCKPNQERNPKTKRCVKKCNTGYVRNDLFKCVKAKTTKNTSNSNNSKPKCPPGKEINPKTGRCVKKCTSGKVRNPATGQCIKSLKKLTSMVKKANTLLATRNNGPANRNNGPANRNNLRSKVAWNISTNGVMLAHTYRDPKSGKINNPPKGVPAAPVGWWMSEKFDGYRAIWDGAKFVSRGGNEFVTPAWFSAWLPKGVPLDGELFLGRECFEKCGIFRRKVPDDAEWKSLKVKYNIFDAPTLKKPFEERVAYIDKLVKDSCKKSRDCPLVSVIHTRINSEAEMTSKLKTLLSKGAEGLMLRAPKSPYDSKRSKYLLKVKPQFDSECRIIGHNLGSGKYSNMLGAFHCEWRNKGNVVQFDISGMNDEIRENYERTHPIGTTITFGYLGLTSSNKPRHPFYLRKREKE